MTDRERQQDEPVEPLELDPETIEDLDPEDREADEVRGGSLGTACKTAT
jgi:hypothetical protein